MKQKIGEPVKVKAEEGLSFIPNQETLDAIEDAIRLSQESSGWFDNFEDFWKAVTSDDED